MTRDPLDDLLDQAMGRTVKREKVHAPKKIEATKQTKVYFDADRFRWYFDGREGRSLAEWRDLIDDEMRSLDDT